MEYNLQIPGQMNEIELKAIALVARLVPANGNIVEVGSLLGLSSWVWAKNADPSVTVNCIDPWELEIGAGNFAEIAKVHGQVFSKNQFLDNLSDFPNIVAHQGYSPRDFQHWNQSVDLLFEDSVHSDPILKENLDFWASKLRGDDSIICGHDYSPKFPDVIQNVDRIATSRGYEKIVFGTFWVLLPQKLIQSSNVEIIEKIKNLGGCIVNSEESRVSIHILMRPHSTAPWMCSMNV